MKQKTKISGESIIPIRVPEDLRKRVRQVAIKGHTNDSHVLKLSIERGIAAVDKMFDMPVETAA